MLLTLAPVQQVILYCVQFAVVGAGFGCLALHLPRMLPMPRAARFVAGFVLTPYWIGAILALLGAGVPGGPAWLFFWLPSLLALAPLAWYGPRSARRLLRHGRRTLHKMPVRWPAITISVLALALLLGSLAPRLWANSWLPIVGHDALLYTSKAATFAEERVTAGIPGLRGDLDGEVRDDSHGVVYPAFLAQAILAAGENQAGPDNDYALRFAFQLSFPLMLLAIAALGSSYRSAGAGALAIILVLLVSMFEYVSYHNSRDAFRIIPLMVFSTLLVGLSPRRLRAGVHPSAAVPLLLLPAAALYGHTLGGIVVVIATGVWAGCIVAGNLTALAVPRRRWLAPLLILAAIGSGLVLGSLRYLELYTSERMLQGYASMEAALAGTRLGPLLEASRSETAQASLLQRLRVPFALDNYRLSLPGILAAFASLAWWWRVRHRRHSFVFLLLGLTPLAIFLPQTGLLDYSGYRISSAFVRNERYILHWYPYAAVCLAGMAFTAQQQLVQRAARTSRPHLAWLGNGGLVALGLAATLATYTVIHNEWRVRTLALTDRIALVTEPLRVLLPQLPAGEHWLLDDDRYNYSLGNRGLVMYTRTSWPVIKAQDPAQAQQALDDLDIGAVALLRADIPQWWGLLPFFDALNDPHAATVLAGSNYLVFDRAASPADYGRQVAAYLAAADGAGPGALLAAPQTPPPELGAAAGAPAILALTPDVNLVLPDADFALAALVAAAAAAGDDPAPLHQARGHLYSARQEPDAALAAYAQAQAAGSPPTLLDHYRAAAYLLRADQLAAAGDGQGALAAAETAASLAPGAPWLSERLLASYRTWGHNTFDAPLRAAITGPLAAAATAPAASAAALLALARAEQELDQDANALALYRQVLARWPQDDAALAALAAPGIVQADWTLAAAALAQRIHNNPADATLYGELATLYLERGLYDRAVALYLEAAAANPQAAWPHLELGKLYQRQQLDQTLDAAAALPQQDGG